MSHPFFERHQALLEQATQAIATRGYWSPFAEMPSPKVYGETANADGKAAFEARLNQPFALSQPGTVGQAGKEVSPYGPELGITYPRPDLDQLFAGVAQGMPAWRKAGPEAWVGVSLEILQRLNRRSFEIAYAVMHTTGQAFMMAFQAGGPHAQDRGLEAVAYAWDELRRIPKQATWEKPQGKNEPLRMEKRYTVVPRGVGLVIGCCTFPTWNGYPGLFASLATGNAVVVKPHPGAILPLAITVEVAREVLEEAGFDPNIVTLVANDPSERMASKLALRPEVRLIDFTGSTANGDWLERNAHQAQVYTEKAGVNQIVIDSTADFKGMVRNIAFSLSLYSGQMCTAPQNIYVPKDGIDTPEGRVSFDQVAAAIGEAVGKLTGDPAKAVELIGAIQNDGVVERIEASRALGEIVADSRVLEHPEFPGARIRTPLVLKVDASDEAKIMQELFGPISFVVATDSTAHSIELAHRGAKTHGALTLSAYTTDAGVTESIRDAAEDAGVALSLNLTGGVFVNQSAAFSDFHATGANPAANASLSDAAFVANRFRVVQSRSPI
ncbi:phenylacetic acid degradation protein PaaN [Cupriavidus taiwanensis]|uniref:Aldehyde deshydrogenase, Phenylacetic acid degradation n=1 Tax=Cupriavidus taiwanensis TaxID=164546 RepID=A0A7Z7JDW3_9BURK|nr:phenylacetic acid degradation protein PaaN [Cupriavidus taiwanensis]SOY60817.1 aldehyde deshydrogenase, Phenylacetic acid degradation [Cupriavidus taiwanensis]SOZ08364.1 aldehyde deshydrogenase, Phenylacetic acid degradation [Cupriavidus taiwanensis]SOZ13155.1 aldehyde deshydrogenase, Phenylacetic acid degradation [Cupriavidus taiwanensis]SOZ41790.1 aldehyde deshydrogenase, Phenylacetic acid degradation [Cupriavidus taiwanensis]SPC21064.1 aldehyde deshydrogenase, Phenylacetic acid degradati